MNNNIEEDIKILEDFKNNKMQRDKLELNTTGGGLKIGHYYKTFELDQAIEHILSDYKKLQEEFKEVDHECSRLEEKEVELEKENEKWKQAYQLEKDEQLELLQKYRTLKQENEELKRLMTYKNGYTKKLEEDLFQNCSNYVIPKSKIKDKIQTYRRIIANSNDGNLIDELWERIRVLWELLENDKKMNNFILKKI